MPQSPRMWVVSHQPIEGLVYQSFTTDDGHVHQPIEGLIPQSLLRGGLPWIPSTKLLGL